MNFKKYISILSLSVFIFASSVGCTSVNNAEKTDITDVVMSTDYMMYDTSNDLIDKSPLIIEGKIVSSKLENLIIDDNLGSDDVPMTELPYTIFDVEVHKVYKGDLQKKDIIQVKQLGGEVNGVTYSEENGSKLKNNTKYVMFLEGYDNSPYSLLNPIQGSYISENGKLTGNEKNKVKLELKNLENIEKNNKMN